MFLGAIYIFPRSVVIWSLYFPLLHDRTLGSTHRSREKGRELPPSRGWPLSAIPCSPLRLLQLSRELTKMTNIQISNLEIKDHKWKQFILVVNFLFGLRVTEIPNKTFILDSHRPFHLQCSFTIILLPHETK
jgi:hypothetical protein